MVPEKAGYGTKKSAIEPGYRTKHFDFQKK
jgi:hypothetical protein